MKRIAFYGGTFDPVHCGHITIAKRLLDLFELDEFQFLPAYQAPHKIGTIPTSAYHRFAMLTLATAGDARLKVSTLELAHGRERYTVETLPELIRKFPETQIFFVMGADSWSEIRTWKEWEEVLLMVNHIVVTRPGYAIGIDHVTEQVRKLVVDLRSKNEGSVIPTADLKIYLTDAVELDVSATGIREDIRQDDRLDRADDVTDEVAKYIEKYELYK